MRHRKPNRLNGYDYSKAGLYFVTICTKDRQEYFGYPDNGKMVLSEIGMIANKCWQEIPGHFEGIEIDDFIIMPDHIHGIIIINEMGDIGNSTRMNLPENDHTKMKLSKIIQQYKAVVSREVNRTQNAIFFQWQKSFYDHIIRNEKTLNNIRQYIRNNPLNWNYDLENTAVKTNVP